MGGETDQTYLDIRNMLSRLLTKRQVEVFMHSLVTVMQNEASWEFVRLLQKYNASK